MKYTKYEFEMNIKITFPDGQCDNWEEASKGAAKAFLEKTRPYKKWQSWLKLVGADVDETSNVKVTI